MFNEELRKLTARINGARGALIMGLDGIAVATFRADEEFNLDALAAEYLGMVKKAAETNRELGIGPVVELTIFTDSVVAILLSITEEYFLVFAVPPNGNYGRARYELRRSAMNLANELA